MIQRQEKGDYLIEYKKFPVRDGFGMSAALKRYTLVDTGMKKMKNANVQTLDLEGGVIRKQVARITTSDQRAMDILFQDLQDNETEALIFAKPNINLQKQVPHLTRDFKGQKIRLDKIGENQ